MSFSLPEYTKNRCGLGLRPGPHWESLQRPQTSAGFKVDRFAAGGEWREGKEGLGKGGNGFQVSLEMGEWEGRGKGEVGGNSALVVGG